MRDIQEGRRKVEIAHDGRVGHALGQQPRRIGDHRYAHRWLIGIALVDQTMIAEQKAIVRIEHDHRVLIDALLLEIGHDAAQAVVDRREGAIDVADLLLQFSIGVIGEIRAMPAVALVAHPHGLAGVVFRRVGHAGRQRNIQVGILVLVALGRLRVGVDRFVAEIEEEGLGLVTAFFQPVHRIVGQFIGDVAGALDDLSVDIERLPFSRRQLCR